MNKREEEIQELWYKQYDYFESCVDKIYEYFHKYGYKWDNRQGGMEIPSRERIEITIKDLMTSAKRGDTSSGRLLVSYDPDVDRFEVYLEL